MPTLCREHCPSLKQLLETVLAAKASGAFKRKMKECVVLKQVNICFPGIHPYKNTAVLLWSFYKFRCWKDNLEINSALSKNIQREPKGQRRKYK